MVNEPEPNKGLVIGKGKLPEKAESEGLPTLKPVEPKPVIQEPATLAPEVSFTLIQVTNKLLVVDFHIIILLLTT